MLYISRKDIESLGIAVEEVVSALETAFLAGQQGRIVWRPKAMISQPDGIFLIGTHAAWTERNLSIFHSILGTSHAFVPPGAPHYRTLQLLGDYRAGAPLALIDGTFTSSILPVAVTLLAARHLARPDSRVATFVAAGLQARLNLEALCKAFPLREIRILSRTEASARALAQLVAERQLQPVLPRDPESAICGADIIITSVPSGPGQTPYLNPAWVSQGAFISAIDGGRSWLPGFEQFDRLVTDDRPQAVAQYADGRLAHAGPYDTEIPELVAGLRPGREHQGERVAFIHPGNIVGVFGLTVLIRELAMSRSLGQVIME
jgi:ornithine cyclodeaminase/alanine dehydrogenase-like protein (mu-crystallin family)